MPTEKIVSCCKCNEKENLVLISQKGKFISIKNDKIYYAKDFKLGYINKEIQLKKDYFIKVVPRNRLIDIETNKNKSARLNFDKLNYVTNKNTLKVDFLNLDKDEYLENCFSFESYLN